MLLFYLVPFYLYITGFLLELAGSNQPCQHLRHQLQVGKEAPKTRSLNSPHPVRSGFCFSHLKHPSTEKTNDMLEPNTDPSPIKMSTPADDLYVLDSVIISDETVEATSATNYLCDALVVSRLWFWIKHNK